MKTAQLKKLQKGFTLIELLVVMGILAVLLAITLIAINPARQFAQANNAKRANDTLQILNAIHEYAADHAGTLPGGTGNLTATNCPIVDPADPTKKPCEVTDTTGAGNINLCNDLSTNYLPSMPQDPSLNSGANITSCTGYDTGYQVGVDAANRITVYAPHTEIPPATAIISVNR